MRMLIPTLALPALLLAACAQPTPKADAVALLRTADGRDAGRVVLSGTPTGVRLQVDARGLTPGTHGFHIHTNGACAPGPDATTGRTVDFGAAGGHFDPGMSHNHGHPNEPPDKAHAGELENLVADAGGTAKAEQTNRHVTLSPGPASIVGRSLVVHAQPDDYDTDPAGNSGPRVLCGVVEALAR